MDNEIRFLILHAYGAANAGDGLLVVESIELLKEVCPSASIDVLALYPESFGDLDAKVLNGSVKSFSGLLSQARTLMKLQKYDLIVGVGGGYLRAGTKTEALKTTLAHGMQAFSASRTDTPVVYLPQSIGPLRIGTQKLLVSALENMERVYVRDDRSLAEVIDTKPIRVPDLALLTRNHAEHRETAPSPVPVLSVRSVNGKIPLGVERLAVAVGEFDGYVQSRGAGNEDEYVMRALAPSQMLSRSQLLQATSSARVVVAVRLHAALMALNAGHWVIHLAYERKGFGAFADLGLESYVHNVNNFDLDLVLNQIDQFHRNTAVRQQYATTVAAARLRLADKRSWLISDIKEVLAGGRRSKESK